jgi:16S rRNA (guanine527-N7)-methyltransferase
LAALSTERMRELLQPFVEASADEGERGLSPRTLEQLSTYLELLLRWNERVNLTAIRTPEEIVRRHFGESLFTGIQLRRHVGDGATLLDYGSGAGFPGLPIQILLPSLQVTLAESHGRKAAFLREVVRTLGLSTEVWARRVEEMPPERRFDVVTLRAVDRMEISEVEAETRVAPGGWVAVLAGKEAQARDGVEILPLPESEHRKLVLRRMPMFHVEHSR